MPKPTTYSGLLGRLFAHGDKKRTFRGLPSFESSPGGVFALLHTDDPSLGAIEVALRPPASAGGDPTVVVRRVPWAGGGPSAPLIIAQSALKAIPRPIQLSLLAET